MRILILEDESLAAERIKTMIQEIDSEVFEACFDVF